jgi:hypothetical protein
VQDEILQLVEEEKRSGQLRAISLTSGIEKSPEDEVRKAVTIVKASRELAGVIQAGRIGCHTKLATNFFSSPEERRGQSG